VNDVLRDARDYGLQVQSLEDLSDQSESYVFIEKLSSDYAETAARYCAASGATTGVGGFATTVALAGVDLANMAAQLYRLNQRLAILSGFDPTNIRHQEKSKLIYLAALGIDTAASSSIRALVAAAAKENVAKRGPANSAAIRLIMEVVKLLGAKMTKAQAAKLVPFAGAALGGGMNYVFAKKAGKRMIADFKSEYFDRVQMNR
jgi:uncharacterized protein YgbK (DUF1537 family)